jgi:hypothetical protein
MSDVELSLSEVLNLPDDDAPVNYSTDVVTTSTDTIITTPNGEKPTAIGAQPNLDVPATIDPSYQVDFVKTNKKGDMVGLNHTNIYKELEGVVVHGKGILDKLTYMISCEPSKSGVYTEAATFINTFNKTIEGFTKLQEQAQKHQRAIELENIKHQNRLEYLKAKNAIGAATPTAGEEIDDSNDEELYEWSMEDFVEEASDTDIEV